MEIGEIITYIGTAIGSGGLVQLANWKWGRRKEAASVKSDEIETMKKAMEDFYDPLLKKQNARIAELEGEVKTLRDQLAYERTEHQKQIESQNQQIAALQKQITEITRALGIKAARQVRNNRGQFTSEKVEEPSYED
jgi:small-conductance mechanosensitive channel